MWNQTNLWESLAEKKNSGELCSQRVEKYREILMERVLIDPVEKILKFGSFFQLARKSPRGNLQNFSVATDLFCRQPHPINKLNYFTMSPGEGPCIRNTFQLHPITSTTSTQNASGGNQNQNIKFNQDFMIQCMGWKFEPLFLLALPQMPQISEINDIQLSRKEDHPISYFRWKFIYPDPEMRLEMEDENVPYNAHVLLVHSATNRLATNQKISTRTLFGKKIM
ncbi:hypothetical protein DMENIID0001_147130 [Sergentomyia squamirostris]